jgi:hypothetical protein
VDISDKEDTMPHKKSKMDKVQFVVFFVMQALIYTLPLYVALKV